MERTPVRPFHRSTEDEVTFKTPGLPPEPEGSEHLPSTEPMDRYVRVTRLEEKDHQTVPTPRVRIDRALEETQRPEHHEREHPESSMQDLQTPQRCDHSPSSQASSSHTTEDHLESLYL